MPTRQESEKSFVVCNPCRVGDFWTEPELHSLEGSLGGPRNRGIKGIAGSNALCSRAAAEVADTPRLWLRGLPPGDLVLDVPLLSSGYAGGAPHPLLPRLQAFPSGLFWPMGMPQGDLSRLTLGFGVSAGPGGSWSRTRTP